MKISTSWTQKDWDDALKKVWKLSRDFDEILNFGLEHGFITSSDIIHASDMYKDPNKIYDEDDIKDFIKDVPFSDLMKAIQDEYDLYDILEELPKDDILDEFNKDDLLDKLDGSWELESHDEEVRDEYYRDLYDLLVKEIKGEEKDLISEISEYSPDELHRFICDVVGCGYYEQKGINKIKEKLDKNNYGIKY